MAAHGGAVRGHVALTSDVTDPVYPEAPGRPLDRLVGLTRLFVHPSAQRAGHARALNEQATATATALDLGLVLDVVLGVVDDATTALGLYRRLGWRHVGSREAEWTTPGGRRPHLQLYVAPAP